METIVSKKEKWEEAKNCFEVIKNDNMYASYFLGSLYENNRIKAENGDQIGEAQKYYLIAAEKANNQALLIQIGEKFEKNKNFEEAFECYKKAIDKNYVSAKKNLNNLGLKYQKNEEYDKAFKCFKESARLNYDEKKYLPYNEAKIQQLEGESVKSFKDSREARNQLNDIGRIYQKKGNYEEAIKYFEEVANAGESNNKYYYSENDIVILEDAKKDYLLAVENNDQKAISTINRLGDIFKKYEKSDDAFDCYQKALDKGNQEARNKILSLINSSKDVDKVKKYYRAIDDDDDNNDDFNEVFPLLFDLNKYIKDDDF